jgi:superfamily II DNA or RNA helicase/diadenosine tetraphosphate (Ap4A) HIT family hydrolase
MSGECPFCRIEGDRVFHADALTIGLWDKYPVNPGHALLVTKRHVSSWFDATVEERRALADATDVARREISRQHAPTGFNLGLNIGTAAGQTVSHLHLHVIPRYDGDVADPRGGIRGVIPSKQNYLETGGEVETRGALLRGGDADPLLPHLERQLAEATRFDVAVAFALNRGVDLLFPHLQDFLNRGGCLRFLTGDYQDATQPEALSRLLDLHGNVTLRIFETQLDYPAGHPEFPRAFHPKSYILHLADGSGAAYVGSSNVSESALRFGVEWNYRIVASAEAPAFQEICQAFDELFGHPATRVLDEDWIEDYAKRRLTRIAIPQPEVIGEAPPEHYAAVTPHSIQEEALRALEETRHEGNRAGLVVLATGLGKTWLSAFDTSRPEFRRVLFVAHREEILDQALGTFRHVRPGARLGLYDGRAKDPKADVLFASIQTLSRAAHLTRFDPTEFDYIVIDEFHHAAAASYRRLLDHFEPKFLLGLTATPERSDGGNLLALCQENLVYRCDLAEGVRRGLLAPFHYFGVPDDIDYSNIPWRSNRFDEEALTNAVATRRRADNALEQWRQRGGKRTLAFCVSQRHANFMAGYLREQGLRAAAVHAGADSAPRTLSLKALEDGELDFVCAVDMFNEGVDLPALDTVMMLRPTESRILWLQQLGRGLRKSEGKDRLNVIDYIGNHKTFLLKPQTLFDLPPGREAIFNFLEKYQEGSIELPPGCEVTYDLETIEILRKLVQPAGSEVEALRRYYEDFREREGMRPTASEVFHDGYSPRSVRTGYGSWLGLVRSMGDLSEEERSNLAVAESFFSSLEVTEMVKSFKMVVLLGMLNADALPGEVSIDRLGEEVTRIASRSAVLQEEFADALEDRSALRKLLETNPINAWVGGRGTGGVSYFQYQDHVFRSVVAAGERGSFQALVRELCEWRLSEYLERRQRTEGGDHKIVLKVSHTGGRPILFLPDRQHHPALPWGATTVLVEGEPYLFDFVKIAVNVARRSAEGENELPRLLRGWFGPDAGLPGTRAHVFLEQENDRWVLAPEGRREGAAELWREYAREQIPGLFGMTFSTAIWNAGFVFREKHIFLLVTLDKSGHASDFQYGDRFLSPAEFEWQSQNRTTQASAHGDAIRRHVERGIAVHLFVRPTKKLAGRSGSAPFTYCGDVQFADWEGDAPITVRWRLPEGVPERLREKLRVPEVDE